MKGEELIKPPRKYVIHNPRLRKIRKEFRTLIKLAVIDEYDRLRGLEKLYNERQLYNNIELTSAQKKRRGYLSRMRLFLEHCFHSSICVCAYKRGLRDADVSGDRVRCTEVVFNSLYPNSNCIVEKVFYSLETFKRGGEGFLAVYKEDERLCRKSGIGFVSYQEAKTPKRMYKFST